MSNQSPLSSDPSSPPVYSMPVLPSRPADGLAIAGFAFALASLLAASFFFLLGAFSPTQGAAWFFIGLIVGSASSIVGVILSALGLRSPSHQALALAGLILSIVVFVLLVLLLLFITPVRVETSIATRSSLMTDMVY